jgi:hypothetical protein
MIRQVSYKPELAIGYTYTINTGFIDDIWNIFQAFTHMHASLLVPFDGFLPVRKIPDIFQISNFLNLLQKYDFSKAVSQKSDTENMV